MLDFDAAATSAVTSGGLLRSFTDLTLGAPVALDVDYYATNKAIVWLVGIEDDGSCRTSRVHVECDDGEWAPGESSWGTWDGWADVACDRPEDFWPEWGPILALGIEEGFGVPGAGYCAVRGIAAAGIVGIEFGPPGHTRQRGVDSPTGAFVIAIPRPLIHATPILKATVRGGSIIDLSP
jgi:hypothetical protein